MHLSAEKFAIQAHGTQKYGEYPYEFHLRHVVRVVTSEGYASEPSLVAAAWLHDVAEDTETTIDEIKTAFGDEIADIVTRVTDEPGASRKERKIKTYPKIKGHRGATIVKLCDRIANVESSKFVPDKYAMYQQEYPEFRARLFIPGLADKLWERLDELLTNPY